MVAGLVPPDEEERICQKLVSYYGKLYPGVKFTRKEAVLSRDELGEVLYTFPGEEGEATAAEKMRLISSAIKGGYSTPIVILRKKGKDILLDGHRRARVAFGEGLKWKAHIIVPSKDMKFGIEGMILGKIRDLYG